MLNEWSDRPPPEPPRRFYKRCELWLGVLTLLGWLAILFGIFGFLAG